MSAGTPTYVRFLARSRCFITGRPECGLFVAAGSLVDSPDTPAVTLDQLRSVLGWFSHNLKVPRLNSEHWRGVFWYTANSPQFISRMWRLVQLVEEEGYNVRKIWTRQPGQIVYRDHYQVAAIPPRRKLRRRSLSHTAPTMIQV